MTDSTVPLLRHYVATLNYRIGKVIAAAPPGFGEYSAGYGVRTPAQILSHIGDVLIWAQGRITGEPRLDHAPRTWNDEVERFRKITSSLNEALASWNNSSLDVSRKLLQGPFADAMTHAGQLAMLSRMAGRPITRENFFEAPIQAE